MTIGIREALGCLKSIEASEDDEYRAKCLNIVIKFSKKQFNDNPQRITPTDALFGFMGWLTSRKEAVTLSSCHYAGHAVELIRIWTEHNKLCKKVSAAYPNNFTQPEGGPGDNKLTPIMGDVGNVIATLPAMTMNAVDGAIVPTLVMRQEHIMVLLDALATAQEEITQLKETTRAANEVEVEIRAGRYQAEQHTKEAEERSRAFGKRLRYVRGMIHNLNKSISDSWMIDLDKKDEEKRLRDVMLELAVAEVKKAVKQECKDCPGLKLGCGGDETSRECSLIRIKQAVSEIEVKT